MAFLAARAWVAKCSRARIFASLEDLNQHRALISRLLDGDCALKQTATMCSMCGQQPEEGLEAEADRLRFDDEARQHMAEVAHAAKGTGGTASAHDGAWKWAIRQRIWDLLERENIAMHPRPVHHRIPNFIGSLTASSQLASLPEFSSAQCIKVNPDSPQKQVRFLTLKGKKKLLVPQPRLRTGFFSELEACALPRGTLAEACTAAGTAKHGKQLGLDAKLKVDFIVIGSVAVDPNTGARLGKGEGFADLEYAMLRHMGAVNDTTLIATTIHDKQLVDNIPTEKLSVHDVPVDIICTPTQVIFTRTTLPKPQGIYWDLLSPEKLGQIQVLQELKKQIELKTGHELSLGPSEEVPLERIKAPEKASKDARIFVWNLQRSTQWTELRDHVANLGVEVLKVSVIRKEPKSKPIARILLKEGTDVESLVKALDGSHMGTVMIRAQVDDTS